MELRVSSLHFHYPHRASVLQGCDLRISEGSFYALLGANGSGKSTLLKLLAGVLPMGSEGTGRVELLSGNEANVARDIRKSRASEWAQQVVYVGSELQTEFPLTAREVVEMGARLAPEPKGSLDVRVQAVLTEVGAREYAERPIMELSGGERQLVAIARALAQGGRFLLLDEALSKMDLHHQFQIGECLRARCRAGMGILLVAHDLNLSIEWADLALVLHEGKIVADGPVAAVVNTSLLQRLYPGTPLEVESGVRPRIRFQK